MEPTGRFLWKRKRRANAFSALMCARPVAATCALLAAAVTATLILIGATVGLGVRLGG